MGTSTNKRAPKNATINRYHDLFFLYIFLLSIPEGIDITPYAIKKAKEKKPRPHKTEIEFFNNIRNQGPMILVMKEKYKEGEHDETYNVIVTFHKLLLTL